MKNELKEPAPQHLKMALAWSCPHYPAPRSFSCCEKRTRYFVGDEFPDIYLNQKQAECLFWAAQGFTSPEISRKLGIPSSSVNSSLLIIKKKFGFPNRKWLVTQFNSGILLRDAAKDDSIKEH